ncbi:MAG: DUF2867 domain-containing protein [Woeseiaceae bacterium]|nr:DUF2867 domain-containing protein [Woeseiaceae bacterium]
MTTAELRESRSIETDVSASALWAELVHFGRGGDFFSGRPLWWLRRVLDWLVGGPSFRRPRRDPDELVVDDVVDSWTVIEAETGELLTLQMDMKAPGAGVLEFSIEDTGQRRRLTQTAYWQPDGFLGHLYWYVLLPAHGFLFRGAVREVVHRAQRRT